MQNENMGRATAIWTGVTAFFIELWQEEEMKNWERVKRSESVDGTRGQVDDIGGRLKVKKWKMK